MADSPSAQAASWVAAAMWLPRAVRSVRVQQALSYAVAAGALDQVGRFLCHFDIDDTDHAEAHAAILEGAEGAAQAAQAALAAPARCRCLADGIALEQLASLLAVEQEWCEAGQHGGEAELCRAVRMGTGHSLRCATSAITGAGDGVFACGTIPRGQVLSVYAGSHLGAWEALINRTLRVLLPGWYVEGYMLSQSDQSSMDGSSYVAFAQRQLCGYVSPSACSQLVNHPPAGILPNSSFMTVSVPPGSVFAGLPVKTRWASGCGQWQVATVLVSLAEIQDGEEVLVDYGMGTGGPGGMELPEWYTPCCGTVGAGAAVVAWRGPSMSDYLRLANEDTIGCSADVHA